jgi:hypothetical protein
MNIEIEKRSRAVSLTVLEIDIDRDILIPAYCIANFMSPALWEWRKQRRVHDPKGNLLGVKRRVRELERHFHSYSFTYLPDQPGGDPWGLLYFPDEEKRLGKSFIDAVRKEYDESLRMLLRDNPDSQFGRIVNEPYYKEGYFPRLRNEIIDVMDAYRLILPDRKGSGKCLALAMLWLTSLVVWGRFSPDKVVLIGNRAHAFAFLLEEEGFLLNNTKQFTYTRIHNGSELSEFVKMVTTNSKTTFLFIPSLGFCHCYFKKSTIPPPNLSDVLKKIMDFLGIPLKHPGPENINFITPSYAVPDPLDFDSAEEYQSLIFSLAKRFPGSIFDFACYAFRKIDVPLPQAYVYAALRDWHAKQLGQKVKDLKDAFNILEGISGKDSILKSRDRIALPDECIVFKTASDRDRVLLLYTLLEHSSIRRNDTAIAFSDDRSYVYYDGKWIEVSSFDSSFAEPKGLWLIFNKNYKKSITDKHIV